MNGHLLMKSITLEAHYLLLSKKLPVTSKFIIKVKAKLNKYVSISFKWSIQHIIFTLQDKKFNKLAKLLIMLQLEGPTTVGKNSGCQKPQMSLP